MVVLGSRDHYCIHPSVRKKGRNINEECKQLLERGGRSAGVNEAGESSDTGRGCGYSHGAMKLASTVSKPGAEPLDIEDLVVAGKKSRACPYFAAKTAAESAELVFCPYNYLLDPAVRSAMDIELKGAIVILDEAHNVEDTSREAASCDLDLEQLEEAAAAFAGIGVTNTPSEDEPSTDATSDDTYAVLGNIVSGVASWLRGASDLDNPRCPLRPHGFEKWMAVWSGGTTVARQMRDMGLDPNVIHQAEEAKRAAMKEANDTKTPADRRIGGAALKIAETLLTSARYALHGRGNNAGAVHDYRLVVQKSFKEASIHQGGDGSSSDPAGTGREASVTLSLWALNPALAFDDLAGANAARCVVLTSGTLAPLNSFASELGVQFPIRMEAPHCVDVAKQVWAGAVGVGPRGAQLCGTFKVAAEFAYQDDLGNALKEWCVDIPHGVLVFFPSYSLLDRVTSRWKSTGLWKALEQATGKKMFQEPRGNERGFEASSGRGGGRGGRGGRGGGRGRGLAQSGDTNALDAMLAKYYRAVRASVSAAPHPHAPAPASHPARGAVLLAVVRGKVSEGIDFADANARGVVVVGVPYPNVKDKRVELKRQYNNEGVSRGLLSGDQWYSQQAFRALNQAVGRCLRHRNDHGAILLADERYLRDDMTRHLPKWLRPAMRKCSGFEDSRRGLRQFFAAHADDPPPIKPEEPAALKPSVGVERVGPGRKAGGNRAAVTKKVSRDADEDDDGCLGGARQKDIRSLFAPAAGGGGAATERPPPTRQPSGPHEHAILITLAEEEAELRGGGGERAGGGQPAPDQSPIEPGKPPPVNPPRESGWRPAPPPPPITVHPTATSELTDPPTQTARDGTVSAPTVSAPTFSAPTFSAPTVSAPPPAPNPQRQSANSTSSGWGDDGEGDAWDASPGTQGFGMAGWGATQQFVNIQPAAHHHAKRSSDAAPAPASERMPPPPPRLSAHAPSPSLTPEEATGHAARDAAAQILGTRRTSIPARSNRAKDPPGSEKSSMDAEAETKFEFPRIESPGVIDEPIAGTQTTPEHGHDHEPESHACHSCGRVVLGPGGILGATSTRVDLSYLTTLLESNGGPDGGGYTPTDEDEANGPRVHVVARADTSAARTVCAQPVKPAMVDERKREAPLNRESERIGAVSKIPEPNWRGDCAGTWVPQDGCYYVPLACGGRWTGVRVEAADHTHAHLAGCTLLLADSLKPSKQSVETNRDGDGDFETDESTETGTDGETRDGSYDTGTGTDDVGHTGIRIDDCLVGTWVEVSNGGCELENWVGRVTRVDAAAAKPVTVRWLARTKEGLHAFRGGSHAVEVETLVELGDHMFHRVPKEGRPGNKGGPAEVFCRTGPDCRCGAQLCDSEGEEVRDDGEEEPRKRRRIRRYASVEASQGRRR
jgi:Fanconi anemia group J protein